MDQNKNNKLKRKFIKHISFSQLCGLMEEVSVVVKMIIKFLINLMESLDHLLK